jgi:NAD(P)H-dependent FMN reductase
MGDSPHIQVILASTRTERRGEAVARWLHGIADGRGDITTELVDVAEFDLPFLTASTPPMNPLSRDDAARPWGAKIDGADGFVFVVPEYNHGYPAALKNALDHLFSEWGRKPAGFVSYGAASGGVRAIEQLRQVVIELDMVPVRRQVAIPRIWDAVAPDGRLRDRRDNEAQLLLDDMAWWAQALRTARELTAAA